MAKSTKNRKNHKYKFGRRSKASNRPVRFPPTISFNRVGMRAILRHVIVNPAQPINSLVSNAVKISDLTNAPWDGLKAVFSQVKVMKVHMYALAGVGTAGNGYHVLNLAPLNEFEHTKSTTFSTLCTLPGSKMDVIGRMITAEWHPTGSDERQWFKIDAKNELMDYVYMTNCQGSKGAAAASFPLELTLDVYIKFRGINYQKLTSTLCRTMSPCGLDFTVLEMTSSNAPSS